MLNEVKEMKSLLSVDLAGKMAHFRKFYANSSSLSYPFPPRTTIAGMLAAILGKERDGYYSLFSLEKAKIGIRIMKPGRTIMQTVNYLDTDKEGISKFLDGNRMRTQVPLEIIFPMDLDSVLIYRIFFMHEDHGIIKEIYSMANEQRTRFPLYFGLTEFTAWIQKVYLYEKEDFEIRHNNGKEAKIFTVLPINYIEEFSNIESGLRIHKDRIPIDFTSERQLKRADSVIWEAVGKPLKLKVRGEIFKTPEECGVFLE
ncbi:CRISPR-associated protein Cas5h [Caldanaerovirga acetigignens]|jgi:CRISPR-associated protein Cas5h|uniref:CRISPR-associated protein Cas5h n=2 Tax=Caldanaerovirga acetigignens TaxID=447595 RepID=A0A1M7LEJ8_9FIRM|nr:CRISPR-associated protein Cas5h [Caldanaerovirga acetigignens]